MFLIVLSDDIEEVYINQITQRWIPSWNYLFSDNKNFNLLFFIVTSLVHFCSVHMTLKQLTI